MDAFSSFMGSVNGVVWSYALVGLCLIAGVFFTIRLKFPQFRLIKEMIRLLTKDTQKGQDGISPFQAFATTVGSRVGMGNIAGVATAIFFGGPGAIVWMWILAFVGASSAFVEASLAQAYKTRNGKEYIGGPALFIHRGLKMKPYAIAFALVTILGSGILMPGLHSQSIASTFQSAFGIPMLATGVVFCAILALVVCGGIKRIGKAAELLAPIMCVIYVLIGIVVIGMNIREVPAAFGLIFSSAFGMKPMFAGIVGSTIAWGVKRGVYSSEAGQGSGAIVSAAAECSHPVKQGLIQALSVYIDTIIVCTISALIIILTGTYNVVGADGKTLLVNGIPNVEYGIRWAQEALNNAFGGTWGGKALAIIIIMFVFTSLMGYYYEAESNVRYLLKNNSKAIWAMRVIFILSTFSGVLINADVIWQMGDTGAGLMAWLNIIAIVLLYKKAVILLKDYETQKKQGLDPMFDPEILDIDDEEGVWDIYKEEKKNQYQSKGE